MKGKVTIVTKTEEISANGLRKMRLLLEVSPASGRQSFPTVSTRPPVPSIMSEEMLDYYGRVFCGGGFANLHLTFDQFLAVAAILDGRLD